VYNTYHVDDLRERQSKRDVKRLAGVQWRTYSMVIVTQQVTDQSVLHVVSITYSINHQYLSSHGVFATAAHGSLCSRVNRPHYGSCLSVPLSVSLVRASNEEIKQHKKPNFVWTFPKARITGVPIFSSQSRSSALGLWLWQVGKFVWLGERLYSISALRKHFILVLTFIWFDCFSCWTNRWRRKPPNMMHAWKLCQRHRKYVL